MNKETARELVKELTAAFEVPVPVPIVPLVRKAARLAELVGEEANGAILRGHLDGVQGHVQPDEHAYSLGWVFLGPATKEVVHDRRMPGGTAVLPLELLEREWEAIRLRLKAETSSSQTRALRDMLSAYEAVEAKIRNRVGSFVAKVEASLGQGPQAPLAQPQSRGNKVFIGHGGSHVWKDLRFFLKDKLHVDCVDFNTESQAGNMTVERLCEMLDQSGFAFLVATAEDQHSDGTVHARENVIHEAGLFQARLGFKCAIVLLEDGCSKFSNIDGVTDIRFPKGGIMAVSEAIRDVLEREGFLRPVAG